MPTLTVIGTARRLPLTKNLCNAGSIIDRVYGFERPNYSVVFMYSSSDLPNERLHSQNCPKGVHFSGTPNQITVYCKYKG